MCFVGFSIAVYSFRGCVGAFSLYADLDKNIYFFSFTNVIKFAIVDI